MSNETKEIVEICEALPREKQFAVAEFARFLLSREDDQRWENLLAYPKRRPELDAFVRESAKEPDEPMDLNRL